jgi:hypothetical protein
MVKICIAVRWLNLYHCGWKSKKSWCSNFGEINPNPRVLPDFSDIMLCVNIEIIYFVKYPDVKKFIIDSVPFIPFLIFVLHFT